MKGGTEGATHKRTEKEVVTDCGTDKRTGKAVAAEGENAGGTHKKTRKKIVTEGGTHVRVQGRKVGRKVKHTKGQGR